MVPLLVIAAPGCDRLMRRTLSHVPRCGLIPHEKRAAFDRLLDRVWSLRDPRWPEALLLVLAQWGALFMLFRMGLTWLIDQGIGDELGVSSVLPQAARLSPAVKMKRTTTAQDFFLNMP